MMTLTWVVLTMGDRTAELGAAIRSIRAQTTPVKIIVVENGGTALVEPGSDLRVVSTKQNIGIPAARHLGVVESTTDIVAFLDDDAVIDSPLTSARILDAFGEDSTIGAVALRIADPRGQSARRHVPRVGNRSPESGGLVATFLGGASAVRRGHYDRAGGYWGELFYAHEELDLAWRLHDSGSNVRFLADVTVTHPAVVIGRHERGWWFTGRNRVMIARRNLPWAVATVHMAFWLVVGVTRAPDWGCRRSYLVGFGHGMRVSVPRRPIGMRTLITLARRGRPPLV